MTVDMTLPEQHSRPQGAGWRTASISVETRGSTTLISASGEVDASNADFLATVLTGFTQRRTPVVLNLADLEFVGTQGLRVLLHFDDECQRGGVPWTLVPCGTMRELFGVFRLFDQLPIVDSVTAAVDSFECTGIPHEGKNRARVTRDKLRC
ncbi:hypothetical protein CQY20_26895 [Mycolicibacterium agri]|uniref:STAS domain-containing protein n=1 Tax=Mycolicibacterium agri TaxID=36811 RepID=A0A2A7MR73_MYCAG|nr:STAS domain-containing protein [Mycolicibacterium agri]PEG34184.1 hypothetical protein CQY20_26895 [Mycolicibacterium agri]GFG50289.1 hypothetical protein MAGR_17300 [Mycolicibacterium agri]